MYLLTDTISLPTRHTTNMSHTYGLIPLYVNFWLWGMPSQHIKKNDEYARLVNVHTFFFYARLWMYINKVKIINNTVLVKLFKWKNVLRMFGFYPLQQVGAQYLFSTFVFMSWSSLIESTNLHKRWQIKCSCFILIEYSGIYQFKKNPSHKPSNY